MIDSFFKIWKRTFFISQGSTASCCLFLQKLLRPQFDKALEHLFLLRSHVKQKRLVLCLNAVLEGICLKKIKCIYHCKECKFCTVKF